MPMNINQMKLNYGLKKEIKIFVNLVNIRFSGVIVQ